MVYLEIEQELEILKNLLNSLERRSIDSAGLYFWGSNLEKARELPILRFGIYRRQMKSELRLR